MGAPRTVRVAEKGVFECAVLWCEGPPAPENFVFSTRDGFAALEMPICSRHLAALEQLGEFRIMVR